VKSSLAAMRRNIRVGSEPICGSAAKATFSRPSECQIPFTGHGWLARAEDVRNPPFPLVSALRPNVVKGLDPAFGRWNPNDRYGRRRPLFRHEALGKRPEGPGEGMPRTLALVTRNASVGLQAYFRRPRGLYLVAAKSLAAIHRFASTLARSMLAEMVRIARDPTRPVGARIMAARTALAFLLPRRTAKPNDEAEFTEDLVEIMRQRRNQLADLRALAIASD